MKAKFLLFVVTFFGALSLSFAQNVNDESKQHEFGAEPSDSQLSIFLHSLCVEIDSARINNQTIPDFYYLFKYWGVFDGSEKDFKPFFHKFLNDNKQKLICPNSGGIKAKHFYKRMFQLSLDEFFIDYIIDPEMKDLDLNAYEIVDGKKETLLDYIGKKIKNNIGDVDTLIYISDTLHEEFGAKFGVELN
jgi:hypothetical protein